MGNENKSSDGITLSKKSLVLLLLLILLLVAGAAFVGMNWNRWFGSEETVDGSAAGTETEASEAAFNPDIDPNAADWDGTLADDDDTEESVGIKIPGYPSITIAADTTDVTMALLNPEGNPCYFTFTLVLKDTEEVLYQSGLVPPGQAITNVTLSRALEAGEYDAVIQITTTSLEDGSAMNGANVETVLVVQ